MHEASRIFQFQSNTNLKESEAPLSKRGVWMTASGGQGPGALGLSADWVKPVAAAGETRALAGRAGPGPGGQGRSGWRGPSRSRRAKDPSLSSPVRVPQAVREGGELRGRSWLRKPLVESAPPLASPSVKTAVSVP